MKGLYYTYAYLKKSFFIWAGILFVIITALGCWLLTLAQNPNNDQVTQDMLSLACGFIVLAGPIFSTLLLSEGFNREIEQNLKCGFVNTILAGMTTTRYCNINLIINLGCLAAAIVITALHWLFFRLADSTVITFELISLQICFLLLESTLNWLAIPLTIILKSQEKAGLILGLGIALPLLPIITFTADGNLSAVMNWFDKPISLVVSFAAAAVLFAVGYLFIHKTVKGGDLC